MPEAYIVAAARTAGGRRKGALSGVHPADLGATVLDALIERSGMDPAGVDDVILGCVTQAGEQGSALARNVVLASSLPQSVPGVTIDRQCGSSQQALHFAAQAVMSGTQDVVIAAGVESMTRVPMGSNVALHEAAGLGVGPWPTSVQERFGVPAFNQFHGAQAIADKYGFTRESMDAYALASHRKAADAIAAGHFDAEIVPVQTAAGLLRATKACAPMLRLRAGRAQDPDRRRLADCGQCQPDDRRRLGRDGGQRGGAQALQPHPDRAHRQHDSHRR
jgi:acetyl-CoA C-acetyltransferase